MHGVKLRVSNNKFLFASLFTVCNAVAGTYVPELHKMVYLQNRRFLSESEKELRHDKTNFPVKAPEVNEAPLKRRFKTSSEVRQCVDTLKEKFVVFYFC